VTLGMRSSNEVTARLDN